ncbi:MAG: ketoacyl-ACP synthase III [Actinobacteria bacterium]|nr:ketoacyl-ACP synthase III [Actinomycetota bacterium]
MASSRADRGATISGIGVYLPEHVVTNHDLSLTLETSDQWIRQRTGIMRRRIAAEDQSASTLAIPAGAAAIKEAGLVPEAVGLVIVASISPDQIMPATASRVAYALGAENAGAVDLSAGCSGFIYALAMATGLVESGIQEHVLVVGAEAISRILDWEDRSTAVLFGDAAGAVVVSATYGPNRILGLDMGNDGSGADLLQIPAGGSRLPATHATVDDGLHYLKMNGREVYRFATRVVPRSAAQILEHCGFSTSEVDLMVPHQANTRIIQAVARRLGIAWERVFTNLDEYGNTSCASIPLCLMEARARGLVYQGCRILLLGFGAGLSWGSCLLRWGDPVGVTTI